LQIEIRCGLFMEENDTPAASHHARLQEVIRELVFDIGWFMAKRLTSASLSPEWLRNAWSQTG
jgi:hypothetical protein